MRHRVEANHLAVAGAQEDASQVVGRGDRAFGGLDADVVAVAVARIVAVLGDVDAARQHVDRVGDVGGREPDVGRANAVHVEPDLRQVELQVEVHPAEPGDLAQLPVHLVRQRGHRSEVRADDRELQQVAAHAADRRGRRRERQHARNAGELGLDLLDELLLRNPALAARHHRHERHARVDLAGAAEADADEGRLHLGVRADHGVQLARRVPPSWRGSCRAAP